MLVVGESDSLPSAVLYLQCSEVACKGMHTIHILLSSSVARRNSASLEDMSERDTESHFQTAVNYNLLNICNLRLDQDNPILLEDS